MNVKLSFEGIIWYRTSLNDSVDRPGSSDNSFNDVILVGGIDKLVCWPLWHFRIILLKGGSDIPV